MIRNTNYDYTGIVVNNLKELIKDRKNIIIKSNDSSSVRELMEKKERIAQVTSVAKNLLESLKDDYDNKKINLARYKAYLLPFYDLYREGLLPELSSHTPTPEEQIALTGEESNGLKKAVDAINRVLKTADEISEQIGLKKKPVTLDNQTRHELVRAGYWIL